MMSVAFSLDGQLCLSASDDKTLCLWELDWKYEFPGWADWDEARGRTWNTSLLSVVLVVMMVLIAPDTPIGRRMTSRRS